MIVVMKLNAPETQVEQVKKRIVEMGFTPHVIHGVEKQVIGAVGDKSGQRLPGELETLEGVEKVLPISSPYKLVSREVKDQDSVIKVGEVEIGNRDLPVMAGPCAVESYEQVSSIGRFLKDAGVPVLRGGAYKPRTSPYSFQGLELEGLEILYQVGKETGLKIVTEVLSPSDVETVSSYADMLQVGARNMQNYPLLKEVGKSSMPVLLKRGMASPVEEWLMSAEYILAEGNERVVLCERGIRTFENYTRTTLDISSVPLVKQLSHLPVIVDPSHSGGSWKLVPSLSRAAVSAGADGLIIEVHHNPPEAWCDGGQSLNYQNFLELLKELQPVADAVGRNLSLSMEEHKVKEAHIL